MTTDATRTQLGEEGLRALAMGVYVALDRAREERDAYRAALLELVAATSRLERTDGGSDVLFGVLDMRTRACAVLGVEA